MIVLAAAMLMAGSSAGPVAPSQERNALGRCLSNFVHQKLMDKMDAAAFTAAANGGCATQAAAFRNAWVAYDVAMKTRRSEAEENAASQVDDYFQNSTDTYVSTTNPTPRPAAASPVTQASSTTPPHP